MSSPPLLALNDGSSGVVVGGQPTTAPFQSLKPSILIILLILSMTILVSVSVCLLLRLLNRHCLRQLSPSSSSATATTTTIIASSSSNRHSGHHHHRVSPETPPQLSILDSLPIFTFGSIKRRSSSGSVLAMSAGDCAVCLSKFEQQDQLRLLPLCCHAFHASCIDTWLESNQTCPLCRSPIQASESDILKELSVANDGGGGGGSESFRLEIGSVSRRRPDSAAESRASYSLGSFDYIVEEDSEISMGHTRRTSVSDKEIGAAPVVQPVQESSLAAEVAGGGRNWLKDYVDRLSTSLSSRAHSFRSSGRFFTGSSRRTELGSAGDYDLEANRVGEEISELFRWVSGV